MRLKKRAEPSSAQRVSQNTKPRDNERVSVLSTTTKLPVRNFYLNFLLILNLCFNKCRLEALILYVYMCDAVMLIIFVASLLSSAVNNVLYFVCNTNRYIASHIFLVFVRQLR